LFRVSFRCINESSRRARQQKQKKEIEMNTTKIVCAVVYVLMIASTLVMVGNVGQYIDMASAIVVVVISVLFAATAKGDDSVIQKFGNGAVRAGWLGSIIGIIAIFGSDGFAAGDLSMLGSAMAVCSLTVFYGYFFKLGAMILD
jgi:amino acid permease